ncbi:MULTISPECIES: UvrD-helicase domain-containing protein [Pseudomonas]|uniref:DNA 3'-5' helicase II n=1 Tax=Pseudomonas aegrilactucae TaxID=2854028 RepID=A0A9Q3ACX3_9PSED|nr:MULTISPECIES: UvrD-helicase domain-containing protein [Pseudomonas]MBC3410164.1 ATP-dependent helicase [Pseudomonas sp. SWRI51]MBV6287115.1 UvrD-helicase domain-containing protein [Pseudomonas aegrilactucae]MDD2076719.1 UvrD-helicase domain-containing protein [Pseudomonas putida]WRW01885.1 UvrD-helicase domain-containing protein [Pseudomonas putida]HDS1692670.1 ATP-dependent helicase [Pseudomonas putida]
MNLIQVIDPITDEDIEWVTKLMKLEALDEPRRDFLKSMNTLDVAACPGSGKTTLVVAKLAILARHWKSRTQGICVLSHTNAAREEIEHRLGGTEIGHRLLRYPHYIDTIHGFTGRFLASPWLRSKGIPLTAFDDELTHAARRKALKRWEYAGMKKTFESSFLKVEDLRLRTVDFDNPLTGWSFKFGAHTDTYKNACKAMTQAAKTGHFCFDEVFVLANALLVEEPEVASNLRARFPWVLVDEMQDTRHEQADILSKVFPRQNPGVCVIRVGDPNQEIFEEKVELPEPFPDQASSMEISSSFRFNQSIASIANPFAYLPITGGLIGLREGGASQSAPNTIIVFPDDDVGNVLDTYGRLLIRHLPADLRNSGVYALGAVHRLENFQPKQYPKAVEHYWAPYQSEVNKPSFKPRTFAEGVHIARRYVTRDATAALGVELIASCLLALVRLAFPSDTIATRSRSHQGVEQHLAGRPGVVAAYRKWLERLLFSQGEITQTDWDATVASGLLDLAAELVSSDQLLASTDADSYLEWAAAPLVEDPGENGSALLNTYKFEGESESVNIRLSSIHSEKGKTHSATLILETFNRTHFVKKLMPWLEGKASAAKRPNEGAKKSMMLMYVGMTRPSHMLCLAVRKSSLGEGKAETKRRAALEKAGWSILDI